MIIIIMIIIILYELPVGEIKNEWMNLLVKNIFTDEFK
jgi:hypothetical protein